MLRAALLGIVLAALAAAAASVALHGFGWPAIVWLGVLAAALAIERRRYGAAAAAPPAGLTPTDERFFDDSSGRLVRVWLDPATGERRYVEDDGGGRAK